LENPLNSPSGPLDGLASVEGLMPTDVVLVRHALSVVRTVDGPDEVRRPLADAGLRQADELVARLSALRPSAVWSSPYRRAMQTVQPTAQALGLDVKTMWDLREWDDGLPYTDDWEPHYEQSWADPTLVRPAGESLDQLTARAIGALRKLARESADRLVLVGSHGTFIARALGMDRETWQRMPMPAVYELRVEADGRICWKQ
jgi:2,3-bisphosphoglycerate-dependent phosphoglycerate mutase